MTDFNFAPGSIVEFRGHFARGGNDIVPSNYAIDEKNCEYSELGVKTRAGFDSSIQTTGNWNGKAVRVYEYKKRNEASRLLILDDTGKIWDSSTPMVTPILSIAGMTDFSAETMYDRVYLSPHDGDRGLSGEKVYVYDGSGVSRPAAGAGPSGYTLDVTESATAGNIEAGTHLFSVAFETSSGHITKFGVTGSELKVFTATGGKKANISGIPIGPAEVVARWIICTKVIKDYDGNPNDKQWFLLPDGRIPNNSDATFNDVSFFDTDLIDSADRLLNQLAEIPAGSCITAYGSRLMIGGERANESTARVSDPGFPEAVSDLTGYVNFNPGDAGGPLRLMFVYRKMVFAQKDYRMLVTEDNGSDPSTWGVTGVDDAVGTSVHGSAGVLDSKGQSLDSVLICSRDGFHKFTGTFGDSPELSYIIADLWKRINQQFFHKVAIAIDPIQKKSYISVPLDNASEVSHILMCDMAEGETFDKVKWSVWEMPSRPSSGWVEVDYTTKLTKFKFGSLDGGIYVRNPTARNDYNNAIISFYRPGFVTADQSGGVCQFQAIRARVIGSGSLYLKLYGIDDAQVVTLPSWTLSAAPGGEYMRQPGFFNSERASVEFGVSSIGNWFHLTKIRLASDLLWNTQWQS